MGMNGIIKVCFVGAFLTYSSGGAWAANLNADCDGSGVFDELQLETIRGAVSPAGLNPRSQLSLTLYDVFVGEPVSRPAFVAILVESHDGRDCYLLEDVASSSGGLGEGFGDAMVEQAFAFRNEQENHTQLFIPVRDYTFASGDETYDPRFVEIIVTGEDDLSLSVAK
ncbi:hypothetical protein [Aurantimonas sp. A3-2-R12]|uniref:hypothetical protein n=1 Tax=Aurantimonas sp. A3-2-R12 TaxID=3114362 RepID=UPI002E16F957|nr:hypothetical protein [Aurantimonas sp. A3-2-R12]